MATTMQIRSIKDIVHVMGDEALGESSGEVLIDIELSLLPTLTLDIVGELHGALQFIFAVDERSQKKGFSLHHIFTIPSRRCLLHVRSVIPADAPEFPSLALQLPAMNWHERKIADMLGLTPIGHPDPRRLVLHEDWPQGVYPWRNDFDSKQKVPRVKGTYEFHRIEGEGVFEIPVGPVHAGIIEPGHFRFSSVGEKILYLELRLFYTHRGIERFMRGKSLLEGTLAAERISGDETVANSAAYSQAIERIFKVAIPERAKRLRAVFLELERIHCHLADIGGAATDIAFSVGAAKAAILREKVMGLCELISGSRFLRGMIAPGGLRRNVDDEVIQRVSSFVDVALCDIRELEATTFSRSSVIDRFVKTGVLSTEHALNLAVVGPVARASGIAVDARIDYPYGFYATHPLDIATRFDGDVAARVRLKFDEVRQSLGIIEAALGDIKNGAVCNDDFAAASGGQALGWVEAPRGMTLCWVEVDDEAKITNCRWRTPSFNNWPALPYALHGNIVPDFPLVNKSFNLSYAGNDL
ncbi:MAG: hydrogenase large subunit [Candidatus Aquicultor sp.]